MNPTADAAKRIVALINSNPQSPSLSDIEAILNRLVHGAEGAAPEAGPVDAAPPDFRTLPPEADPSRRPAASGIRMLRDLIVDLGRQSTIAEEAEFFAGKREGQADAWHVMGCRIRDFTKDAFLRQQKAKRSMSLFEPVTLDECVTVLIMATDIVSFNTDCSEEEVDRADLGIAVKMMQSAVRGFSKQSGITPASIGLASECSHYLEKPEEAALWKSLRPAAETGDLAAVRSALNLQPRSGDEDYAGEEAEASASAAAAPSLVGAHIAAWRRAMNALDRVGFEDEGPDASAQRERLQSEMARHARALCEAPAQAHSHLNALAEVCAAGLWPGEPFNADTLSDQPSQTLDSETKAALAALLNGVRELCPDPLAGHSAAA